MVPFQKCHYDFSKTCTYLRTKQSQLRFFGPDPDPGPVNLRFVSIWHIKITAVVAKKI